MENKGIKNTAYCMDVNEFLNSQKGEIFDLVIADPPYNQKIAHWDNFSDQKSYFSFIDSWLEDVVKKIKKDGSIYLFNNPFNSAIIFQKLIDMGLIFQNWIIWYKKDGFKPSKRKFVSNQEVILFFTKSNNYIFNYDDIRTPYLSTDRMKHAAKVGILKNGKRWFPNTNGKLCNDVWEISSERHKQKVNGKVIKLEHPTTKPYKLIERIIKASSNKGDLVMDLFSGSGMTSIVAKDLLRNSIACDSNEKYVQNLINKLSIIK
jgi:site-specific DNA-methyltransferase (adenine-specific)